MEKFDIQQLNSLPKLAKTTETEVKQAFQRIKKKKPKNLDAVVHDLHEQAFEQIDCLDCANCCKSLGPRLTDKDIDRLAKALRVKPSQVIEQHLKIDEDNDYVFRSMPCPFLAADNYCLVYENRPKACREYPHTDRRRFVQLLPLTLKNRSTCPAVHLIAEELRLQF